MQFFTYFVIPLSNKKNRKTIFNRQNKRTAWYEVMVNKFIWLIIAIKFDSHWVSHIYGFLPS